MKKKIYLNAFRGFEQQIIELEDVNFLVGENSTGKTSFLNIISILSSNDFWYNYEFNNSEIEFGYFEEIISKNSVEQSFQIGTERLDSVLSKEENIIRTLLKFKSEKSLPKVESLRFAINDLNIDVEANAKKLKFIYYTYHFESFGDWLHSKKKIKKEIIEINLPGFRFPIPILFQIFKVEFRKKHGVPIEGMDFSDVFLFRNYTWLAPIRAKAKRIYESYNNKFSPEGNHVPSLLKNLLSQSENREKNKKILEQFGKGSNLFDSIEIKELGDKDVSPFEIIIKYNEIPVKLVNVGYGVSQILPLVVEMLSSKRTTFSIQQPEVHLHPKAQAAFGSFLFEACLNEEHTFLIETHSDYTINRFRYSLNKESKGKDISSQILFFSRLNGRNTVTKIPIAKNGSYVQSLPENYSDFFIDEELKLLEI